MKEARPPLERPEPVAAEAKKPWVRPVCVRLAVGDTEATTPVGTLTDGPTTLYSAVTTPVS